MDSNRSCVDCFERVICSILDRRRDVLSLDDLSFNRSWKSIQMNLNRILNIKCGQPFSLNQGESPDRFFSKIRKRFVPKSCAASTQTHRKFFKKYVEKFFYNLESVDPNKKSIKKEGLNSENRRIFPLNVQRLISNSE